MHECMDTIFVFKRCKGLKVGLSRNGYFYTLAFSHTSLQHKHSIRPQYELKNVITQEYIYIYTGIVHKYVET